MKKLKRLVIYLRLWFIKKMGYTLPSLREANCVVPGQLYDHFGRIVHAVPNKPTDHPEQKTLHMGYEIPEQCLQCDLMRQNIPCSFNHRMANGGDICDKHHFEIICLNRGNI